MIPKGTKIWSPDNKSGYELTRDLRQGEHVTPDLFIALGDANEPKSGETVPSWVMIALNAADVPTIGGIE